MNKTNNFIIFDNSEVDQYRALSEGKPFRLFKYGKIYKNGHERRVTPELKFKLPKFKVPLKLGSHDERTPAGGWITALEYREDGVYASAVELSEKGKQALEDGDFRYHSPEVIWENGYIEDAETGEKIQGPLIVGVALTHTPHLGETAALYTYSKKDNIMEKMETVNVPKDFFERVLSLFQFGNKDEAPEVAPDPEPEAEADEFALAIKQRDDYKAQLDQLTAERERADLLSAIGAEFEADDFGVAFSQLAEDDELIGVLADTPEEIRTVIMSKFKALSAQVSEGQLTDEIGDDTPVTTGVEGFAAAVDQYIKDNDGISYVEAVKKVASQRPEMYEAWRENGGK